MKVNTLIFGHDRYIHDEIKKIFNLKYVISEEPNSDITYADLLKYNLSYDLSLSELSDDLFLFLIEHYHRYCDIDSRRYAAINAFQGEINSGMLVYARFFLEIIQSHKIELIIFQNCPHESFDYVAYLLAKYHGIMVIMTHQSRIDNRFWITDDLESFGQFDYLPDISAYQEVEYKIPEYWFDVPAETKRPSYGLWNVVCDSLRAPMKFPVNLIRYYHDRNYQSALTSLPVVNDYGCDYLYIPLHLQPELTTSALGGFHGRYSDQIQVLEQLRRRVPRNIMFIIKENPKQTFLDRGGLFFKRLRAIENLRIADGSLTSRELIENALGVATITGTAGWEAICLGKPCLVFGNAWFQSLPNATKFTDSFIFEEWLSSGGADLEAINEQLALLLMKAGVGIVDPDLMDFLGDNFDKAENSILYVESVKRFFDERFKKSISTPA